MTFIFSKLKNTAKTKVYFRQVKILAMASVHFIMTVHVKIRGRFF